MLIIVIGVCVFVFVCVWDNSFPQYATVVYLTQRGRHFADDTSKFILVFENFIEICAKGSSWWCVSIGSDNGLASISEPNMT